MSVRAVQWALETRVGDATAKLVLLALADESDNDGLCWPFQRRVAARAEVSTKTVSRKIDYLVGAGLLTVGDRRRSRRNGRLSGYSYTLALADESDNDPPPDRMSTGDRTTDEDAAYAAGAVAPPSQHQDAPSRATGAATYVQNDTPVTPPAPDADVRAADPASPVDNLSTGQDVSWSSGHDGCPLDQRTSWVSAGKDLDPPEDLDPPPPTPSTGGGGPAAAEPSPPLVAVLDRLDDLRRRRLLAEPPARIHALEVLLHAATVDGWPPDQLATALTDGSLDGAAQLTAVVAHRTRQLTAAGPPRRRSRRPDIPPAVLAALEAQAGEAALVGTSIDPDRRRQVLTELIEAWHADHDQEVVG